MATEKKSWNAMDAKEQDDRRKEERFIKRLENSSGVSRDLIIKKILEEKGITNPNSYRSEQERLNNLASNFDFQQELKLKKSYESKWSQSSAGIQAAVNNQGIRQELSDFNYNLNNNRNQMSYIERQELNRKKLELENQLRFSDAQLAEDKNSWISQTQSEDDRLAAYNEKKDHQEYVESKYGKNFQGDPGGKMQLQMQAPSSKKVGNQGEPGQSQQGMGQQQQSMQNPAMAQRKTWRPYDARTGRSLSDTQLNQVYRNDAAMYRQMGGATDPRTIAQNPYLSDYNGPYEKRQRNMKFEMSNFRNPKAINNYYQNRNF